jgi:hypothetical protein
VEAILEAAAQVFGPGPPALRRRAGLRIDASHPLNDQELELAASFRRTTVQDAE